MGENLIPFLKDKIPCCEDGCRNCETNTEHNLESKEGTLQVDQINDIEKYVHTILDSDDQEGIECKKNYNNALAQNKEMHKLHDNLENLNNLDKGKLEEMKQTYDPKSEDIFE